MGSNSLLEGMVLGEAAGIAAGSRVTVGHRQRPERILKRTFDTPPQGIELGISDLIYSMKSLMWRHVGLERDDALLKEASNHLSFWFDAARRLAPAEPRAWELVNMLTVASMATEGALLRQESRGVHFRTDYTSIGEAVHTLIQPTIEDHHCVSGVIHHQSCGSPANELA